MEETKNEMRRSRRRGLAVGVVIGGAGSAFFFRRHLKVMAARYFPYMRRQSTVDNPALIINRWSGDGKAEQVGLADVAEKAGITTIMLERGDDLRTLAENAVAAGADAIGMAGGDGSLGVVAAVAVAEDMPFFCVPVGTRNHFALDLGLDRDNPLAALDALDGGDELLIDYGDIGGRLFLNNASFGVYAQAVHTDGYRGDKVGTVQRALSQAAADPGSQAQLDFTTPDGVEQTRCPMLLVSVNQYEFSGPPDFGRRTRLDDGKLGATAVTGFADPETATEAEVSSQHLQTWETETLRIQSDEPILTGVDGEALSFESPLDITVHQRGLRALVPTGVRPGYEPVSDAITARLLDLANLGGEAED